MKPTIVLAALSGLVLTIAGAVGAHMLGVEQTALQSTWNSALLFGFAHVIAAIIATYGQGQLRFSRIAAWAFLGGVLFFSLNLLGATALQATSAQPDLSGRPGGLAVLAPVGGLSFMVGWIVLAVGAFLKPNTTT